MSKEGKQSGIQWVPMITLIVLLAVQQAICGLLYADLPFIIEQYFPGISPDENAKKTGFIISLYQLAQLPGNLFWGWAADKWGRRVPLICTVIADTACMFLFGVSRQYSMGLAIRVLWGVLDGHLCIVKTIITEISSQSSLALGTGLIFAGIAIGSFVGPIIGGYFSDLSNLQGLIKRLPFIQEVPFSVPFTLCAVLSLLCLVLIVFSVPETLDTEKMKRQRALRALLKEEVERVAELKKRGDVLDEQDARLDKFGKNSYWEMAKQTDVLVTTLAYGLLAMCQTSFDTVLPSWLVLDKDMGGFSLDRLDLGQFMSMVSLLQAATLVLLPPMTKAMKTTTAFNALILVCVAVVALTPSASVFARFPLAVVYAILFVYIGCFQVFRSVAFNCSYVLIANSCVAEFKAKAFGISQVFAGLLRGVGPVIFPFIFSWSTAKKRSFPLNYGLAFYAVALTMLLCLALNVTLPAAVNTAKKPLFEEQELEEKLKAKAIRDAEKAQQSVTSVAVPAPAEPAGQLREPLLAQGA